MRPIAVIVGLLLLYAVLAWTAVRGKSPTYDEPLHVAASLAQKRLGDYRVDPEDPALFKHWLALSETSDREYPLPTQSPFWNAIGERPEAQWAWSVQALYGWANGDAEQNVANGRLMMLLASLALGGLIAAWAWHIGGPAAAIIATAIFTFDPNFLGHGPIAKNDVIFTLAYTAVAFATWRVGRRATAANVAWLAAAAGVAMTVKFSGVILAGLVPLMLALSTRLSSARAGRTLLVIAAVAAVSLFVIWASYGFRDRPSPDPSFQFNLASRTTQAPILRKLDAILPDAYTYGLAYTIDSSTTRDAFLLGRTSNTGWWYYFPVAMAVKTPLATMLGMIALAALLSRKRPRPHWWTIACLAVPAGVYLLLAMRSNLNIGLRHVLPVYPLAFIAIGVGLARYRRVAMGLVALLAIESLIAFPNYLAYFNAAAGGSRGGVRILSDSNLDWGQDLPLLADWQARHPNTRLYLSYFGTADPGSYGIDYINAGAGYGFLPAAMPSRPGVFAVSATHLQGLYVSDELKPLYAQLRRQPPLEVLGGTIYLFEWK